MLLSAEHIYQIERNGSLLQSIQPKYEIVVNNEQPIEYLDYFISSYPRKCSGDIPQTNVQFAYSKNNANISFSKNQDLVLLASNYLFEGSIKLEQKLQTILEKSFEKNLKRTPTRPNRK